MSLEKTEFHPRNRHQSRYDFKNLIKTLPELKKFIIRNKFNGEDTIEFSNAEAVKLLNRAILKSSYNIIWWDIPKDYLCPPIPGRADYIHYAADLIKSPILNSNIRVLDIGCGANCVYPLIGNAEYSWRFVGSDIDPLSVKSANKIVSENKLNDFIEIRLQEFKDHIFQGIIKPGEIFDLSICNPPFYASREEASESSSRKTKNLGLKKGLNFGGQSNELWVEGGEIQFIKSMILESVLFKNQVKWFTSLVSSKENLSGIYGELKRNGNPKVKTFEMKQGQKISRFVGWSFTEE